MGRYDQMDPTTPLHHRQNLKEEQQQQRRKPWRLLSYEQYKPKRSASTTS
jgi:hypothetical protein